MNQITTKQSGFDLKADNMDQAMKMANMLAASNMVPKNYKNNGADTLVAMMMGSELGLNPIQSLQNIAVINGRPAIYGDALLALVQNHPKFGGITESFNGDDMVATCTVWRKGGSNNKHTVTFSQGDAVTANLWGKTGPWTQYPKRMITMRARGFALRNQFADALLGLITAEEAEDMPGEVDMGDAEVVNDEPEVTEFSDEEFNANFKKWSALIESGAQTKENLKAFIESKGVSLSGGQISKINGIEVQNENG